jgi:transcriptional regulator with XRE-family HTH domain
MKSTAMTPAQIPLRVSPYIPATIMFWRKLRRMTQRQLAVASGLSESAIKKIESGRKHGSWTGTLEQICAALGITLMELISGAEKRALAVVL